MKKLLTSLLAILMITVAAQAQDDKGGKKHRKHHQEFSQKLNLTESQKTELKAINDDFKKQMAELKKNENITVKEQKEKRKAITDQHQAKIQGLLTAEQKTKLEQLKQEHKNKRHDGAKKGDRKGKRGDHKEMMAKMKTELGLTDDQTKKMEAARADFSAKAKAIKENTSLTDAQKKEQFKELASKQKETTKSILTKEQQDKLESMRSSHRQHKAKQAL